MQNLVVMKDEEAVTTSLKVAETFRKQHKNIIQSIKNLTAKNSAVKKMFVQSTYSNSRNQSQPMYYMNRDGFTLLVVGFTGKKAMDFKLKYIEAFNQMEQKIRYGGFDIPQTKGEALQLAADYSKQIEEMKPKALFSDAVTTSKSTILVGQLAKLLRQNGIEIGQQRLFNWLREHKYLSSRKGADWNTPTQKAMDLELFKIKESTVAHSDGHTTINKTTKVTGKGQLYFINLFLSQNNKNDDSNQLDLLSED